MSGDRMKWWREARFGMIIHWGLYCIPAGDWKGQTMDFIGEWLMSRFRIPIAEYELLAQEFNPVGFDADEWARLASRAGMKYMVFTAKHHDGFAMYHSEVDRYNIVDATPFTRDPVGELAEACGRHGIKLCLYYSQALDWHERDAGGWDAGELNFGMSWGNDWDFPNNSEKQFGRYLEQKVKPQLRELLTRYGPIGAIWFDTPFTISREQCQELYDFVRSIQPECIMNDRLGHGLGDYGSLGDNMIAGGPLAGHWETIATMNDTWGYKRSDGNWKLVREILALLTGSAAKNVNYALNVGPMRDGRFPEPSVKILEELGEWMEMNGESVHATLPTPYASDLPSGPVTHRTGKMYFHLHRWPGGLFKLNGLRNEVEKAYLLTDRGCGLKVRQYADEELDLSAVEVELPEAEPAETLPVLALEFEGAVEVDGGILQQADGSISLPVHAAEVHRKGGAGEGLQVSPMAVTNWLSTEEWLSWDFKVFSPGVYQVRVISTGLHHSNAWRGGHKVKVCVAGSEVRAVLEKDEEIVDIATRYYPHVASVCGEVAIERAGLHELALRAEEIESNGDVGLAAVCVELTPIATR